MTNLIVDEGVRIPEFDMVKMMPHYGIVSLHADRRDTAFAILTEDMLWHQRDQFPTVIVQAPSERAYPFYSRFIPDTFIRSDDHDGFDRSLVTNALKRQRHLRRLQLSAEARLLGWLTDMLRIRPLANLVQAYAEYMLRDPSFLFVSELAPTTEQLWSMPLQDAFQSACENSMLFLLRVDANDISSLPRLITDRIDVAFVGNIRGLAARQKIWRALLQRRIQNADLTSDRLAHSSSLASDENARGVASSRLTFEKFDLMLSCASRGALGRWLVIVTRRHCYPELFWYRPKSVSHGNWKFSSPEMWRFQETYTTHWVQQLRQDTFMTPKHITTTTADAQQGTPAEASTPLPRAQA